MFAACDETLIGLVSTSLLMRTGNKPEHSLNDLIRCLLTMSPKGKAKRGSSSK